MIELIQGLARTRKKPFSSLRKFHASMIADKQGDTNVIFQITNSAAHCRRLN